MASLGEVCVSLPTLSWFVSELSKFRVDVSDSDMLRSHDDEQLYLATYGNWLEFSMDVHNLWFTLLTIFAIGGIALGVLILHKTRRVHLSTFTLERDLAATRKETEALFGQFQALLALERKLALPQEFPPMRGWAGSPDFLLVVANELLLRKPKTVMECSSGVSTVIAARCMQLNGSGHVYSLEHDFFFAGKTRELLDNYGLSEWATVLDAPLETRRTETPWYAEDVIPNDLDPIEVLIIDGPPQPSAPLARLPALPRLVRRMAANAVVILDDANREDEREIVKRWKSDFPDAVETRPMCEKGCAVLRFNERRSSNADSPNSSVMGSYA